MKGLYFDKSDGAGDAPDGDNEHEDSVNDSPKPKKVTFSPEQQAEIDHLIGATRTKERAKAQADFDAKKLEAKAEADKAAMAEQGKFKELAEKADKDKADALTAAEEAKREAKELKLQIAFEDAAEELEYGFVSKQAAKDAFKFLDQEVAGEDGANMKKALEKLNNDRPYLFDEAENEPTTDARQKGTRQKKEVLDKEKEAELISRFRIRRPR